MQAKFRITCGILTLLALGLSTSVATAQTEVFGSGSIHYSNGTPDGGTYFRHIAVNAWLDEDGVAHGTMAWQGDVNLIPEGGGRPMYVGGLSDPFVMDVIDIFFDSNTAYVYGIVVHAPNDADIGGSAGFLFNDNSGTGEPDEIDGTPIDAGNITVW